jgi:hypothetical protein
MSEPWYDVKKMIPALAERTRTGGLSWFKTDFERRFGAKLGAGAIYIYPDTAEVFDIDEDYLGTENSWAVAIENEDGIVVGTYQFSEAQEEEYRMLAEIADLVDESLTKRRATIKSMAASLGMEKGN